MRDLGEWKRAEGHKKNYIYFGMAFSFIVEMLNLTMRNRAKRKAHVVKLNEPVLEEENKGDEAQ